MNDKFVVSTNEIGEIIVTDVETDRVYRYDSAVDFFGLIRLLNEQQATINELQSIINHIKCEENCEDYDYCCETVNSLYNEIKHLKEENEQLRRLFEEMKQPITINLTEEDEKELRKLLGLIDDE